MFSGTSFLAVHFVEEVFFFMCRPLSAFITKFVFTLTTNVCKGVAYADQALQENDAFALLGDALLTRTCTRHHAPDAELSVAAAKLPLRGVFLSFAAYR